MADEPSGQVYFEHIAIGHSVKVTAIDGATAIEVSIVGPAHAARADLERLAFQKLMARLARQTSER